MAERVWIGEHTFGAGSYSHWARRDGCENECHHLLRTRAGSFKL